MSELLKLEKRGHTAIITMNNPPANTWTFDALASLKNIIEELNNDKENYSLILTSDSEKFFSAGADLKLVNHNDKGKAFAFTQAFEAGFGALLNYQGVSIAAITGFTLGGGLEAALCCDIRICEQQARMSLPEAAVGLLPCGFGTQLLPLLVGEGWAKRMMLLGDRIKADKAEQIGLVQEVVETGTVLDRALEMTSMVEKQSPTSVRYCKELIMEARNGDINAAFNKERELFVKLWDTQDQKEGVSAFIEKRPAVWKNA